MNVILIMSDSFRSDHLGCYGNDWIKTPNIDKLAKESVVFENAYPEGLPTVPVRTALLTGNYTLTNRFWQQLTPEDVTIAEILDEYNYVSAMITDTYHLFKPGMNFHRGFHVWRFIRGQQSDAFRSGDHGKDLNHFISPTMRGSKTIRGLDQYLRNVQDRNEEKDYFAARVIREAVDWLEKESSTGRPFFLYVDIFDPHEPWDPPESFTANYVNPDYNGPKLIEPKMGPCDWISEDELQNIRALYAGEVSFVDKWIGHLIEKLGNLGVLEDSLVVFMSDHGAPHGEHGNLRKTTDNLYNELLKIPLIMRFPNGEHAGKRIKSLVSVVDVLPTIMEVLGYVRETNYMQGKSALPLITGQADKIQDYLTMGFFDTEDRCIRDEQWSYIRRPSGQKDELYDVISDPQEMENLIDKHPQKAREMESAIAKIFNCRLQKQSWVQLRYDVPGLCEGVFPPSRKWQK